MGYFPVDDQFAFHPKAVAAGNAAIGLWARAGSWTKSHAEGGHVPAEMVSALGTKAQAKRLVEAGLWELAPGGYRFHDWERQAGNFSPAREKELREAARERQRRKRERDKERDEQRESRVTNGVTHALVTPPPSPSPLPDVDGVSHVPERESYPQTDDSSSGVTFTPSRPVDLAAVRTAVARACERVPSEAHLFLIVQTIIDRTPNPDAVKSWTAWVVKGVKADWAAWQQLIDTAGVSA